MNNAGLVPRGQGKPCPYEAPALRAKLATAVATKLLGYVNMVAVVAWMYWMKKQLDEDRGIE